MKSFQSLYFSFFILSTIISCSSNHNKIGKDLPSSNIADSFSKINNTVPDDPILDSLTFNKYLDSIKIVKLPYKTLSYNRSDDRSINFGKVDTKRFKNLKIPRLIIDDSDSTNVTYFQFPTVDTVFSLVNSENMAKWHLLYRDKKFILIEVDDDQMNAAVYLVTLTNSGQFIDAIRVGYREGNPHWAQSLEAEVHKDLSIDIIHQDWQDLSNPGQKELIETNIIKYKINKKGSFIKLK
jgi:hypothetical protein